MTCDSQCGCRRVGILPYETAIAIIDREKRTSQEDVNGFTGHNNGAGEGDSGLRAMAEDVQLPQQAVEGARSKRLSKDVGSGIILVLMGLAAQLAVSAVLYSLLAVNPTLVSNPRLLPKGILETGTASTTIQSTNQKLPRAINQRSCKGLPQRGRICENLACYPYGIVWNLQETQTRGENL
jgi:hypothetical protein